MTVTEWGSVHSSSWPQLKWKWPPISEWHSTPPPHTHQTGSMCCGMVHFPSHVTSHSRHLRLSQGFLSPEGGKHVKRQWALGLKNPWTSGRWINWFTQCYFTRDISKQFQTLECLENMSPTWGAKQSSWLLKIHSVIWTTKDTVILSSSHCHHTDDYEQYFHLLFLSFVVSVVIIITTLGSLACCRAAFLHHGC